MWELPNKDMLKEKPKRVATISAATQFIELLDNEEWGGEHFHAKLEQDWLPQAGGDDERWGELQRREDWRWGGSTYDGQAHWAEACHQTSRGTLEKGGKATFAMWTYIWT